MKAHTLKSRALTTAVLAAIAGLAASAQGQDRLWLNPVSGAWNVPANWNPADVPNSTPENAVMNVLGTYSVTMPGGFSASIGSLTLGHAGVSLLRADSGELNVLSVSNNGLIQVGNGGPNGTSFRASVANTPLTGTGTLRLAASANADTAYLYWNSSGTQGFLQAASHTIAGSGNIYCLLENNGLVDADVAGLSLRLISQNKSNAGTMRATNGGTLEITGIGITQTGSGTIRANGGSVRFSGSTIANGAVINSGSTMTTAGTVTFQDIALSGTLNVQDNSIFRIGGVGITNAGSIVVNDGVGANGTPVQAMGANTLLGGAGSITLNATPNLDTAYLYWTSSGTQGFTQAATHTIRGTGRIYALLTNDGLVDANVSGRILQMNSQDKTNNSGGVFRASNGGTLDISSINIANAGTIEALNNSLVTVNSSTIAGGVLQSAGNGFVRTGGGSVFSNLANSAPIRVTDNASLILNGVVSNNNVITVNETAGANATYLRSNAGNSTITGTGTIALNAGPNIGTALLYWNSSGSQSLTQSSGHTIRGTGQIYLNLMNNGLVNADQAAKTLQLLSQPKTNNSTFRASNGGTMDINSIAVTNNGTIEALNDSTVNIASSTIIGGSLQASGTGLVRSIGGSVLSDVANSAPLYVVDNSSLILDGAIGNNSVITVNETAGTNTTYLRSNVGNSTITGTGTILMNAGPDIATALLYWNSSSTQSLTQSSGHTIRGTGQIQVNLINDGLVNADQSGKTLQLTSQAKTNNNIFRASNGGTLNINSINIINAGTMEALDGSTVTIASSTILGGSLTAAGSGQFRVMGASVIDGVSTNAPINIGNAATLRGVGTIVNNNVIVVNDTANGNPTNFQASSGNTTLSGSGSLRLNAHPSAITTANLAWHTSTGQVLIQEAGHSLIGRGAVTVRLLNNGTISPGATPGAAGEITFNSQVCTLGATSLYWCDINGTAPADYDRLTGSASRTLGGTLHVNFGFQPITTDFFDIITGPYTGRFATLQMPKGYYIEYLPSAVRIYYSGCLGDWDQDGDVDSDDITLFFGDFENGEADYDQDDDTDSDDIIGFFSSFESGC